ncbi:MAG: hypothetical protein HY060_20345 [Proteobacteria bacterium]|nr:hypothetical protein [Pseudomonadota bacterium]
MRRAVGAVIGGLGILLAAQAAVRAQPADQTFVVVRYHEAARAAELCADKKFTRVEQDKLAVLVGQETRHQLPVGEELIAIRAARTNMEQRITAAGCNDPLVADALRFFNSYRDRLR